VSHQRDLLPPLCAERHSATDRRRVAGYYGRVAYHPGACSDFLEVRTVLVPLLAALQAAQCEAEGDRGRRGGRDLLLTASTPL
jgi:hypothetical protein